MARRERTNNTMARRERTDNTMARRERTNNDLQNIKHKAKNRVTRTPQKTGGELRRSGRVDNLRW